MTHPDGTAASRSGAYAYYVVGVFMLAYTLSFMDRVLLSLLIEPIRREFLLGDTQVGLLIGFGFVLFYSAMGIPFGVAADRGNRRNLIVLGIVGWSLATMGSGLAVGFGSLLVMRMLVGFGEATLSPAALSTIADRFPPARLGFAVSLYSTGVAIGGGLAFAVGGVLISWANGTGLVLPAWGAISGWRLAFLTVGCIGIPLAFLMLATVQEAPRASRHRDGTLASLLTAVRTRRTAVVAVLAGYGMAVLAAYVPLLWSPVFLARELHLDAVQVGAVLRPVTGFGGVFGVLLGGALSDRMARRKIADAPVRVVIAAQLVQAPLLAGAFLSHSVPVVVALLSLAVVATSTIGGLQAATIALLIPPHLRGTAMAVYLLVVTLIGMGLGPLLVGLLSDHLFGSLGPALATVVVVGSLGAVAILIPGLPAIRRAVAAGA